MTDYRDRMRYKYVWEPKLPTLLVAADKTEYQFPAFGLWLTSQVDKDDRLLQRGFLNRKQCKALWQWLKRDDPPPAKLWIYLDRKKFEQLLDAYANKTPRKN